MATLSMPVAWPDTDLVVDGLDSLNAPYDTFRPDSALFIFHYPSQCDPTGFLH